MLFAGDGTEPRQPVRGRDQAGAAGAKGRRGGTQEAAGSVQGEGKLLQELHSHVETAGTTPMLFAPPQPSQDPFTSQASATSHFPLLHRVSF
ncbi:hypothetical protein V5799_011472 [Amblyomma americanum]|uniref:Uncharacterized protein n=1 Tax=Amblyomma americanum TaxID=6943 RepID=A0AAQ4EGU4_AMBAM